MRLNAESMLLWLAGCQQLIFSLQLPHSLTELYLLYLVLLATSSAAVHALGLDEQEA